MRTGKRVAVVGSGLPGLAAAQQLNRAGHWVTVFEKADRIGGLLRYGIPDFKMEKHVLDRRLEQMAAKGVEFQHQRARGRQHSGRGTAQGIRRYLLAGGAEQPRDLNVPGRELKGIHFAMDFLPQQNKRDAGDDVPGSDSRHRQARRDHRRRRHRRGLPGHVRIGKRPRPCISSKLCRCLLSERSPQHAVAAVAAAIAHGKFARRRRHARLGRGHHAVHRATPMAT